MFILISGRPKSGKTTELIRILPRNKNILLLSHDRSTYNNPDLDESFKGIVYPYRSYDLINIDQMIAMNYIQCLAIDTLNEFYLPIPDITNVLIYRYPDLDIYATCNLDYQDISMNLKKSENS